MRSYELFFKPVFEDYVAITHANVMMWRHVGSIKKNAHKNEETREKQQTD